MSLAGRALALGLAALALAGCGGAGRTHGEARLWITRDRGTVTMVDADVGAGQTLLRALRSRAKVETRYGGRFVEAIDGVAGSLSRQHDWFWFVNGVAGDRSSAEYRLRPGDVAWWDYRDWTDDADLAVVVGAFPEPFLHGYGGRVRPAAVRYARGRARDARRIGRAIHARLVCAGCTVPSGWNVFELGAVRPARFSARSRVEGDGPSGPVEFSYSGDVSRLLAGAYARRFAVP